METTTLKTSQFKPNMNTMTVKTNANNQFMKRAIELAMANVKSGKGGPFGAVIVKDGKIIAEGANQVTVIQDPTAHAEVVAIRNACKLLGNFDLSGCELYTSCEPCPMCLGAIYWARPEKVYYAATRIEAANAGFDDEFIYKEINVNPNERQIPMAQMNDSSVHDVFQAWVKSDKKIDY